MFDAAAVPAEYIDGVFSVFDAVRKSWPLTADPEMSENILKPPETTNDVVWTRPKPS
jgi:hypothetical protein